MCRQLTRQTLKSIRLQSQLCLQVQILHRQKSTKPSTAEIVATDVSQPEQSSIPASEETGTLAASNLSLSNGPCPTARLESGLTNDELAALPILVSALRELAGCSGRPHPRYWGPGRSRRYDASVVLKSVH